MFTGLALKLSAGLGNQLIACPCLWIMLTDVSGCEGALAPVAPTETEPAAGTGPAAPQAPTQLQELMAK